LFAAAMIVGNEAGLPAGTLNAIGLGYLISRGVYTWCYINITTERGSLTRYFRRLVGLICRSAVWWFANILCFYPLIKGGYILSKL
jgi:uncharacterized MAPEG superfamily protein